MEVAFLARARAKVNLGLEVIAKRRDGYHEIETIYQSIDLYDTLEIRLGEGRGLAISCNDPSLPVDETNLCARALAAAAARVGRTFGGEIKIEKLIPPASGLGGGSSDAAAVLLALNQVVKMPALELEAVAAEVGSDVPFFLYGGAALGRGRGEKLTRLEPLRAGFFLIVKPPLDISTAWVYENYNFRLTKHTPKFNLKTVNAVLARFPEANLPFRNALEDVVCPAYPAVAGILDELLAMKPCFASMSGSGAALYAIFLSEARAAYAAEEFSLRGNFTAVVRPTTRAVDLSPIAAR